MQFLCFDRTWTELQTKIFKLDYTPNLSSAKRKRRQQRNVEDSFYQIQQYDQMLDDKLVELRALLEKEK